MGVANVAWVLAANGKRVLVADWDLESPGVHRFFRPFLDPRAGERPGIIDFIRKYEWAADEFFKQLSATSDQELKKSSEGRLKKLIAEHVRVDGYVIPLNWSYPGQGTLDFLSAGKQTSEYQAALSALDWETFYNRLCGAEFFEALRAHLKQRYDYVLIDSRTGLSDVADICTIDLPDVLVDCFTLSIQGTEGAATVASLIKANSLLRSIRILPVPMRIDLAEQQKAEEALALAARLFEGLPAGMSDGQRREYWASIGVPYRPFYAYEETLAIFGDPPGAPTSLLSSFERITAQVTEGAVDRLPPMEESLRLRTRLRFSRSQNVTAEEVVLDFLAEDQLWAEWIASVLAGAGIAVRWASEAPVTEPGRTGSSRTIALVTAAYINHLQDAALGRPLDLALVVTDTRLPHQMSEVPVVFLEGLSENRAADLLVDRLDGHRVPGVPVAGVRYPGGTRSQIVEIPVRNANFTGREKDLRELRTELRARGVAVVSPVALRGLGGVGKTQVALEYAHRFKADYDMVWWINCGQPQYVDVQLADLGRALRKEFGIPVPEEGSAPEVARTMLSLLADWEGRWLIVYDNAEDIATIQPFLATGHGHVLITSRSSRWAAHGPSLEIDVFSRDESVQHLRQRLPAISDTEAVQVAIALGDLPLAVATAGAWLAETGNPVPEYLLQLERQPTRTLSQSLPGGEPVEVSKTWDVSLDQLQKSSAEAARLFEFCSVMSPDISLELIYSNAMAMLLARHERAYSDSMLIGSYVRQIDRLALIKLDTNLRQIHVHRLVQEVVRDRMSQEQITITRQQVHEIMTAARPEGDVDDPKTWGRFRVIFPHLRPSGAMLSRQENVRQLFIDRVRYLWQRGDLERGLRRAKEIEAAWEGLLADQDDKELAGSLQMQLLRLRFNMANILRDLAQFEKSRTLDEATLAEQQELLSPEHPHALMTAGSLAADLRALGEYDRALELDRSTYASWQNGYGDDYPGTLSAAHNCSVSLRLSGNFRNALATDRTTLDRRKLILGDEHPRTLASDAAVARDLLEEGHYEDVASQAKELWSRCRTELGDDDRATLNARVLLGVALRSAGHPEEAANHIDEARRSLTRGFGGNSSDALAARLSHANNLLALHKVPEAAERVQSVLSVYEERLGPTHPHSLTCKLNLASTRCLQESYGPALELAQAASGGLEQRLGEDHPYTLAAKMTLAAVLASVGRHADAAKLEAEIYPKFERVLGAQHPDTLRCRANTLLTLHEQGTSGASADRQQVIEKLATLLGSEHPDIAALISGGRLLRVIDPQPF
ncbi:MAG TPA: FxSxx-COOH system tetratricopeptide repeat protein [Streptosporangiaceae bacterium]|jgi:MinD-like ATPase involved in chromosome partitioning or flagellar assembly|nr:FxSxx-COOH system tetratricopeptide repeat protein [Streptosporangiaceae bacterium]